MSSLPWSTWLALRLMRFPMHRARQRFEAQVRDAARVNADTLRAILQHNRQTAFGRAHGFASLRTVADYQRALPVREYADFRPEVERIARGERNVLCADEVEYLGLTSGTTGQAKRHPVTGRQLRLMQRATMIGFAVVREFVPAARSPAQGMLLMNAQLRERSEGGVLTGNLSSISLHASARRGMPRIVTSPQAVFQLRKHADALYLHLLFGLRERGLGFVQAPFVSGLLDLMHLLERRGPELVEDLGRGVIRAELELEPDQRRDLEAVWRPAPARARELAQALEGGARGLARRVWPELAFATSIIGASFSLYTQQLAPFLEGVPLYPSTYISTEATLGVAPGLAPHYVPMPGAAFLEFIPEAHLDANPPPVLLPEQLVEGEAYELVLTTWAGMYRYRLGDVVRVVGRHGGAPLLEVLYRRGTLLNLMGEKTSEQATHHALREVMDAQGLHLSDYTVVEDTQTLPGRYAFFVELQPRDGVRVEPRELGPSLDASLRRANPVYALIRGSERLGSAALHPVTPGTFQALREVLVRRGASPTQVKVPRAVRDPELVALLRGHRSSHEG
ncbi:GH3 auxin-responsive promoter family protein [Melittangium boletus]|uniref:GH3 auxin-responsive promoter n=1 Tax=Melittangium boletus DSM 14713 TaxID=1294270 RepID=A0A250IGR8_9BACT|nr:GH3 auxin-responsive promoter family protein [Melittangium boletus]ATB31024.1 hypothetical protein MEBOL_004486 [Melittangium boletus DSM 14713]